MRGTTRVALEPCWVLHARPWRDTSLLVEVLARDHGRVGLVARGVRGPRARFRGLLQLAQPLLLSWGGRGELKTLSGCEADGPAVPLRGDALLSLWYMNELSLRLLQREDPHPALFATYTEAIHGLSAGSPGNLRVFEKRLLDELGWGPDYGRAADDGSEVVAGRSYGFSADRGVLAAGGGEVAVEGATLLALAQEHIDDPVLAHDARRLLRVALDAHLGDRPLQSRELLRQWPRV